VGAWAHERVGASARRRAFPGSRFVLRASWFSVRASCAVEAAATCAAASAAASARLEALSSNAQRNTSE
jgi:hypothetical protein